MKNLMEMRHISKYFPGVRALDDVSLSILPQSILAIVGENGAGKSTLMKVLSGVYATKNYSGEIYFDGELCNFTGIKDSEDKGIVIIHQELALVPELSIKENIFLGNEFSKSGVIDWEKTTEQAAELLDMVGLNVDPNLPIKYLGVGQQQLVEIAKALGKNVKLLIMDEPTAALNDEDSERLLNLIRRLRSERGISVIIISHKLNEVLEIADYITVIRDGTVIETLENSQDLSQERIVKGMVGRQITNYYPDRNVSIGDKLFEVKNWNVYSPTVPGQKKIDDVSFHVNKGEVVGITGLMGAGRTELARSIYGRSYGIDISGEIYMHGSLKKIKNVRDSLDCGIAYVTEDRKGDGLILGDDIKTNITLPSMNKVSSNGVINKEEEIRVAENYRQKLNIKTPDVYQNTVNLSGGNQQKVMLARFLFNEPELLILDEPTRGIDVGAKHEIYGLINQLVASGKGVVVISSELPEVIGVSDRIYVMNEGKFIGEVNAKTTSQEEIMSMIVRSDNLEVSN